MNRSSHKQLYPQHFTEKAEHTHPQWFGSDLACELCNPVCWQNHGFGKEMALKACGDPKCPNNAKVEAAVTENLQGKIYRHKEPKT